MFCRPTTLIYKFGNLLCQHANTILCIFSVRLLENHLVNPKDFSLLPRLQRKVKSILEHRFHCSCCRVSLARDQSDILDSARGSAHVRPRSLRPWTHTRGRGYPEGCSNGRRTTATLRDYPSWRTSYCHGHVFRCPTPSHYSSYCCPIPWLFMGSAMRTECSSTTEAILSRYTVGNSQIENCTKSPKKWLKWQI